MAKSKSGGTRAYISGRVGSDVYSVGLNAKGKKQQVVRSLAESVKNPQTLAQMRGRMIMSTVMQTVSALRPIIDHSFDSVPAGQPNVSEFIRRNYALVKIDAERNPNGGNAFGLNMYQEKGAKKGAYIISDGQALLPVAAVLTPATATVAIDLTDAGLTVAGLKTELGLSSEEYMTLVGIKADGAADFIRFRVSPDVPGTTAISAANVEDIFLVEGNAMPTISLAGNVISIADSDIAGNCALIVSRYTNGGYIHNSAVLSTPASPAYSSDIALPTYPIGEQMFLNGGELYGQGERNGAGQVVTNSLTINDALGVSRTLVGVAVKNLAAITNEETTYRSAGQYVVAIDAEGHEFVLLDNSLTSRNYGKSLSKVTGFAVTADNTKEAWINGSVEANATYNPYVLNLWSAGENQVFNQELMDWFVANGVSYTCFTTDPAFS